MITDSNLKIETINYFTKRKCKLFSLRMYYLKNEFAGVGGVGEEVARVLSVLTIVDWG